MLSTPPRFPLTLRIADIETCALILAALEDYATTCEADALNEFTPALAPESHDDALAVRLRRSAGRARRIIDELEDAQPAGELT